MNQPGSRLVPESGIDEADRLLGAGKLHEADRILRDLVLLDPDNARLLGLQGMVALRAGETDKAVEFLTRSLVAEGPAPVIRRNIQAFLTLTMSLKSGSLMERALAMPVPIDDAGDRQGPEERQVIGALVEQLAVLGRLEQALAVLEPFMPQLSDRPRLLELFGALKLALGKPEEALGPLKMALRLGEPTSRLLLNLCVAAGRTGDRQTQMTATTEFVNRFPLYVSDRQASQTTTIGVGKWLDGPIRSRDTAEIHYPGNFIAQLARHQPDRYRIVSVLFNSAGAAQAMKKAPRPDVLFNALSNSEIMQMSGAMDTVSTLYGSWGGPIINHPEKVLPTNRLSAPKLYAGLNNWLIPEIAQYSKDENIADIADRIEEDIGYPVIVRGLFECNGRNMSLAGDRGELLEAVKNVRARPYFYAVRFYESRHENGLFRKFRAAIAGDTIQIIRMSIDTKWIVHGGHHKKKMPFSAKYPEFIQQEIEICRDADGYFGLPVMDSLRAMRSRNPLDVFGIDFDVMPDGRLLYFEANASMFLLSDAPPGMVPYPRQPEDDFLAGFDRYINSLKLSSGGTERR